MLFRSISFMSFSGTTVGATTECVGTVSASAKGVAPTEAVCSLTGAVTASVKAICSFCWSRFWCFRLSFLYWKNYMFGSYIIFVSNKLVC